MARIGIFGGSFDPPHLGHMLAVREFQKKLALDTVLLIPAGLPPHKTLPRNAASAQQRLEMCRLAAAQLPFVEVSDLELRREGMSYTADTVELLHRSYPADTLILLMGTDMFLSFGAWHCPERITACAEIAVAHREKDDPARLARCAELLRTQYGACIRFVENEYLPHSSTSVRAMLAFGAGCDYLDPRVMDYIASQQLFYAGRDLRGLDFQSLREVSLSLHKAKRVAHVVGCSQTAQQLAQRWGADETAAARAGILHDVTKALNAEEQLQLCRSYGMILDNFERENPKLLHAKTGAAVAQRVFGEKPEVCEAIRYHTTGKADMTTLEKIIYLADYMEPNRDFDGVETLRQAVARSLDDGMRMGLKMTMEQLVAQGRQIAADSRAALRFLEERTEA